MDEALAVFSRKGMFETIIRAADIRSTEDCRKLWPLATPEEPHELVTWVRPSFSDNKRIRRGHFRKLPLRPGLRNYDTKAEFLHEEQSRQQAVNESAAHKLAKELIAAELRRRLDSGLPLPWSFKDQRTSDFHLEGNLLLGATAIATEQAIHTPFSCDFRLDVAILGPPILSRKHPLILGGIEIEFGHAFDGRKALLGKSLGFPLISVDTSEMTIDELTPRWAQEVLSATTVDHDQGRRKTYVYINDLLYPVYVQLPDFLAKSRRHQYLVFTNDASLEQLQNWLNKLAETLGYSRSQVAVGRVNGKSEQARKDLEQEGKVVGPDWSQYNNHQLLRVTLDRPADIADWKSHQFHMTMARLLLSKVDAVIGYKYANRVINDDCDEDLWLHHRWMRDKPLYEIHRVLPKRLAESVPRLIKVLNGLRQTSH